MSCHFQAQNRFINHIEKGTRFLNEIKQILENVKS